MQQISEGAERRRFPRLAVRVPVRLSTIDPEPDPGTGRPFFRTSDDTCANLSHGGLFIQTDEPLTPGRRLLIEVRLPDGQPVEVVGRVAWVRRTAARASPAERSSASPGTWTRIGGSRVADPTSDAGAARDDVADTEPGIGVELLGGIPDQLSALHAFLAGSEPRRV